MDLLKGLENGFFHTWQTGDSNHRVQVFKEKFKQGVDAGKFIRDIQNAPRDARYKIDHYYHKNTCEKDTIPYPYLGFFEIPIRVLGLDETFNFKKKLRDVKGEYTHGDFTIGFGSVPCMYRENENKDAYYFKYKGEINTLMFNYKPELVNYNDKFWAKYKDKVQSYDEVDKLFHNLNYFILYKKLDSGTIHPKLHPLSTFEH